MTRGPHQQARLPLLARAQVENFGVAAIWLLMLISVQPWSRVTGLPNPSASTTKGKGVLVGLCVIAALVLVRGPIRTRIPRTWWFYLAYAATAVLGSLLIGGSVGVAIRALRLVAALLVPLILWPLLRQDPARLIRATAVGYASLTVVTLLGIIVRPGNAWLNGRSFASGGRLTGALLPMLPPRVGEVGAITAGLFFIGWAHRRVSVWISLPLILSGGLLIYLSRTRTAALAMLVAVIICALATRRSGGGRRIGLALTTAGLLVLPFLPVAIAWVLRNQSGGQLSSLSGRTVAWNYIFNLHVGPLTQLFGHGLGKTQIFIRRGDNTLNFAAIDNSWLSLYYETGIAGFLLVAGAFLSALWAATQARTPYLRATCVFLTFFLVVEGFTETGLSDVSALSLLLMVAAMSAHIDRAPARPRLRSSTYRTESSLLPAATT